MTQINETKTEPDFDPQGRPYALPVMETPPVIQAPTTVRTWGANERKYKLVEMYESVKGEGTQAGIPMLFIRFSKCNLACTWCDTPYDRVAFEIEHHLLVASILAKKPAWVVFTGGEPCLQLTKQLAEELKAGGVRMALETNGMVWSNAIPLLNYINISPKLGEPLHENWLLNKQHINEIRFTMPPDTQELWDVFGRKENRQCKAVVENPRNHRDIIGIDADWITISPLMDPPKKLPDNWQSGDGFNDALGVINRTSLNRCLYLVQKYRHLNVRLSVQVHKFIGER